MTKPQTYCGQILLAIIGGRSFLLNGGGDLIETEDAGEAPGLKFLAEISGGTLKEALGEELADSYPTEDGLYVFSGGATPHFDGDGLEQVEFAGMWEALDLYDALSVWGLNFPGSVTVPGCKVK